MFKYVIPGQVELMQYDKKKRINLICNHVSASIKVNCKYRQEHLHFAVIANIKHLIAIVLTVLVVLALNKTKVFR